VGREEREDVDCKTKAAETLRVSPSLPPFLFPSLPYRRLLRLSGTSPATMRCASPSTMAVLPTPGSPISTGLFLVRRERT